MDILRLTGFEPVAFGTEIQCSIQLSYKRNLNHNKIMIQLGTILRVADNSGAKTVRCIKVLGGFKRKYAVLGDVIVVSIHQLRNRAKDRSKVKRKDIYKALIIRTKIKSRQSNGFEFKFNSNSVALINKFGNPVGTRIIGPVYKRFIKKRFQRFASVSAGIIR